MLLVCTQLALLCDPGPACREGTLTVGTGGTPSHGSQDKLSHTATDWSDQGSCSVEARTFQLAPCFQLIMHTKTRLPTLSLILTVLHVHCLLVSVRAHSPVYCDFCLPLKGEGSRRLAVQFGCYSLAYSWRHCYFICHKQTCHFLKFWMSTKICFFFIFYCRYWAYNFSYWCLLYSLHYSISIPLKNKCTLNLCWL